MREYTSTELANVQNYLMWKGHACPHIDGDTVHYLDRTKGLHRVVRSLKIDFILEEIRTLRKIPFEHYTDKGIYTSGGVRYGVSMYQIMENGFKLLYAEDLPLELRGKYD